MNLRFRIPLLAALAGVLALAVGILAGSADSQTRRVQTQNENLTVFFTGDSEGEITPCGCPELDYGGASRRMAFVDTLRGAGWEFLLVDAGGLAPYGEGTLQNRLKTETLARTLAEMDYDAIALGHRDLALGRDFVARLIGILDQPVLATNLRLGLGDAFQVKARTVVVRGVSVGVVAFLDPRLLGPDHGWVAASLWEDEAATVAALRDSVDVLVALVNAPDPRLDEFAALYPAVDLVIGTHRSDLSTELRTAGEGEVSVVGMAGKGRYLGRVEVSFTPEGEADEVMSRFLPVVETWGRRKNVDTIVGAYFARLRTLIDSEAYLAETLANLKEPPFAYVGNEACASCHGAEYDQWLTTGHARAMETLVAADKDQVPECQSCHTTGFGFRTGFATATTTPEFWQVGCESCHGPGGAHVEDVAAPYGIIVEDACLPCHTSHDSPDWDYETYLPKTVHVPGD